MKGKIYAIYETQKERHYTNEEMDAFIDELDDIEVIHEKESELM